MIEFSLEQLLEVIDQDIQDGTVNLNWGKYDGDDFAILDSWEDVAYINGLLNGFRGLKNHFGPYREGETILTERERLVEELKQSKIDQPTHLGTHNRLEREIAAIDSVVTYKKFLSDNNIDEPKTLDNYVEWGFSDEYQPCCGSCNGCSNIVRTSPDSYHWTAPLLVEDEGGYACDECVESGEYDDYVLENYANTNRSIPDEFDLDRLGLVKANEEDLENGWYGGQLDDPRVIVQAFQNEGIDVWFRCEPSQFEVRFDALVKPEDLDKAKEILGVKSNVEAKEDPAEVLKRGLQGIGAAEAKLPEGEGIKYSKINSDGTVTSRLVSKEEFIKGIKD